MRVTPRELRQPINKPRGVDLVVGAALSSIIFAPLAAVSSTTTLIVTAWTDPSWMLVWLICSFFVSLIAGFFIAILWGIPMAALLARLLHRTQDWRIHLAGFAALGGTTGALVVIIGGLSTYSSAPDQMPWLIGAIVIAAIATASGWAISWSISRADPQSDLVEDADTRVGEDSRAEDALIEEAQG